MYVMKRRCFAFFVSLTSRRHRPIGVRKAAENTQKDKNIWKMGVKEAGGAVIKTDRQTGRPCRHVGFLFCSERPDNCTTVPHSTHSRISQQALQASLNKSRSLNWVQNFTQQCCRKTCTDDDCNDQYYDHQYYYYCHYNFHHILAAEKNKCVAFFKKASFLPLLPDLIACVLMLRLAAGQRTVVKHFPRRVCWQSRKNKQTHRPTQRQTDWLTNRPIRSQDSLSLALSLPYSRLYSKRRHAKVWEGQTLVLVVGASVGRGLALLHSTHTPPAPSSPMCWPAANADDAPGEGAKTSACSNQQNVDVHTQQDRRTDMRHKPPFYTAFCFT